MERRDILKAAAWSVPVIAAAVATPMASASEPTVDEHPRIRFTNTTATVGGRPNTVYVNTKINVIDGPEGVNGLNVYILLKQQGRVYAESLVVGGSLNGWGSTDILRVEFPNLSKNGPIEVLFHADADGVIPITGRVDLMPPSWWS